METKMNTKHAAERITSALKDYLHARDVNGLPPSIGFVTLAIEMALDEILEIKAPRDRV
jgi:hypothetical protein